MMRICPECRESVIDDEDAMCQECEWKLVYDLEQDHRSLTRFFMGVVVAIVLVLTVFFLSGCAAMDGYDRSHSFTYQDAEGRSMNYAINLRSTKGYAK